MDSTFTLKMKYFEAQPQCIGKWRLVNKNTIKLICNEQEVYAMLTNGYMNERVHRVKILDTQRVKFNNTILEKTEQ